MGLRKTRPQGEGGRSLLGLEGEGVTELVGVLVEVPGVDEEAEGALEVGAELLLIAEADLAGGVELGLDGGVSINLVLGADLDQDVLVAGAPGGLGGEGDVLVGLVVVGGHELGELLVGMDGHAIVLLGVADGGGVVGDGGGGHVEGGLGTGNEALVAKDGIGLDLGGLEDVGGGGGDEGVGLEVEAELDLLLGGVGVEGGLEVELEAVGELGGLNLDGQVVGGGVGVGEDEAGVGVLELGLDLALEGAVDVVALEGGGELLRVIFFEKKEESDEN